MLLLSPAPTCQIREHRRLQVRLRFEMDHEDQRVADYPERGDYRYDDAVADDAPDVRLDDPQTVVRVLSEMSQGFWSEINSRQSWVIGTGSLQDVAHRLQSTIMLRISVIFATFIALPFARYWGTRDERSRPIFFVEAKPFSAGTSRTSGESPLLATSGWDEGGFCKLTKNYGSARFNWFSKRQSSSNVSPVIVRTFAVLSLRSDG